jgi:hypothetical protein
MVTVAIFTDAARWFGRDVKNEIFAEILSAWKSSLPPATETLESLITAKIVETQSPLTMTVTIVVLGVITAWALMTSRGLRNSSSWLKRPRETLYAEPIKPRFHFAVMYLGTGAGIC